VDIESEEPAQPVQGPSEGTSVTRNSQVDDSNWEVSQPLGGFSFTRKASR
jgi:hypothetical protein